MLFFPRGRTVHVKKLEQTCVCVLFSLTGERDFYFSNMFSTPQYCFGEGRVVEFLPAWPLPSSHRRERLVEFTTQNQTWKQGAEAVAMTGSKRALPRPTKNTNGNIGHSKIPCHLATIATGAVDPSEGVHDPVGVMSDLRCKRKRNPEAGKPCALPVQVKTLGQIMFEKRRKRSEEMTGFSLLV